MDYTTLVSTIKSYAENTFPDTLDSGGLTSTQQIDTFIQQAEQRIYHDAQLLELRKNVTGATTASNRYLSVPTDWIANFSLAVIDPSTGKYDYLLNKDVNFIHESFPDPAAEAKPTHYANFDKDTYLLGPTPDQAYTMELYYFYMPTSIVTAANTWLGDNFDQVLLYGTLLEAATFMKEAGQEEVLTLYQPRYDEAFASLKQLSEGKHRQDTHRTPQARQAVR